MSSTNSRARVPASSMRQTKSRRIAVRLTPELGERLDLAVAVSGRVLEMSQVIGVAVVVAHAIDDDAAAFYEHQGFTRFRDEPNQLDYPLATFAAAIASPDQPPDDSDPVRP